MRAFSSCWSRSRRSNAGSGRSRSGSERAAVRAHDAALVLEHVEVLADRDGRDAELRRPGRVTRARPCSSTRRAMSSWRSRAKTSPGAAPVGTVTRGLHADPIAGNAAVSGRCRRILSRSDPQCQETILKSIESCGRLAMQPVPNRVKRTGRTATAAMSAPPTSSPGPAEIGGDEPLRSFRIPRGAPADERRRHT